MTRHEAQQAWENRVANGEEVTEEIIDKCGKRFIDRKTTKTVKFNLNRTIDAIVSGDFTKDKDILWIKENGIWKPLMEQQLYDWYKTNFKTILEPCEIDRLLKVMSYEHYNEVIFQDMILFNNGYHDFYGYWKPGNYFDCKIKMDFDYEDATEDDIKPIRDVFGDQFDLVSKYVFDMVTSPKQHRRFLYIQGEKGQGKTHIWSNLIPEALGIKAVETDIEGNWFRADMEGADCIFQDEIGDEKKNAAIKMIKRITGCAKETANTVRKLQTNKVISMKAKLVITANELMFSKAWDTAMLERMILVKNVGNSKNLTVEDIRKWFCWILRNRIENYHEQDHTEFKKWLFDTYHDIEQAKSRQHDYYKMDMFGLNKFAKQIEYIAEPIKVGGENTCESYDPKYEIIKENPYAK